MKYLLKQGMVVSGTGHQVMDILLENGKIKEVASCIHADDAEVLDLNGKIVFPGFIDAHTHFDLEVSGTVTADDFYSGTKAAISGGTTLIIDFATQNKGETLKEALQNWHKKADGQASCDYAFHMAISDWNEETARQISDMMEQGVSTFKLYMTYPAMRLHDGELYEALKTIREAGGIAGVHCENADVIDALTKEAKNAGHLDCSTHPRVRPAGLEAEAVDRLLTIAKLADTAVIVVHLTSVPAYEVICRAREKGQMVFAETCPQYLLLDDSLYEKGGLEGSKYVCAPPLRGKEDQNCLWTALKEDRIQTIGTDHCSFTMKQKAVGKDDFTKIPNGMPGTETRGPLLYTYGAGAGKITLEQMCRLLAENPAKLYGIYPQKGCLSPGSDGDIVILDPHKEGMITAKSQESKADYVPFEGWKLTGCIDKVFLRGNLVVNNGSIVMERQGVYTPRQTYRTDF